MHDSCLPPELLRLAENESLSKASRPLKEMTCFCTMALQKGTHRGFLTDAHICEAEEPEEAT